MAIGHHFEVLYLLVQKDLRARYKSSFLGYIWALANPFAFACVYYFTFKMILHVQTENYAVFLLTGMFPWNWLASALTQATGCYRHNSSLVKRVQLNRAVLPLASVVHEMVHFFFTLPVLLAFIYFSGLPMHASWLWQIPLLVGLQLLFLYPLALLLSLANVYAHDVEYLVGIALSLLFFLTPIVYTPEAIPAQLRCYFDFSPIAALIGNWREVFLQGTLSLSPFLFCFAFSCALGGAALSIYRRAARRIGELL